MTRLHIVIACFAIVAALVGSAYGGPPVRPKTDDKFNKIRRNGDFPLPADGVANPQCPSAPPGACLCDDTLGFEALFWSCSCTGGTDKVYLLSKEGMKINEGAKEKCDEVSYRLVTHRDADVQAEAYYFACKKFSVPNQDHGPTWIGLEAKSTNPANFEWFNDNDGASTSPVGSYSNWGTGQPAGDNTKTCNYNENEKSAAHAPPSTWINAGCDASLAYVMCEDPRSGDDIPE